MNTLQVNDAQSSFDAEDYRSLQLRGSVTFDFVEDDVPTPISDSKGIFTEIRRSGSRENVQHNLSRAVLNTIKTAFPSNESMADLVCVLIDADEAVLLYRDPFCESWRMPASYSPKLLTNRWQYCSDRIGTNWRNARKRLPESIPQSPQEKIVEPFFKRAQRLDDHGQTDTALDLIYDTIDELMLSNHFSQLNDLLSKVDGKAHSGDILLGLLTASLPGRQHLPARAQLFSETERILKNRGEWERGLLDGLEQ